MSPGARPRKPAKTAAPIAGYSGKPTIDKLGVKPGMRVSVIGLEAEKDFGRDLAARTDAVTYGRALRNSGMILVRMEATKDLRRLTTLARSIEPNGAIWVVWPKGRPELKEDHVRVAAIAQGLVDVKVCAFSETLSALKLVIPLARR